MEVSSRSAVNFKLIGDKQTRPSQLIQTLRHKNVKSDFLTLSIDELMSFQVSLKEKLFTQMWEPLLSRF